MSPIGRTLSNAECKIDRMRVDQRPAQVDLNGSSNFPKAAFRLAHLKRPAPDRFQVDSFPMLFAASLARSMTSNFCFASHSTFSDGRELLG